MVAKLRKPKYVKMDGKRYKITGYTEGAIRMAVAEHRVKSATKDFGWRTVKNISTRTKLYAKI